MLSLKNWRFDRAHSRVLARFGVQSTSFHVVLAVGIPENAFKTCVVALWCANRVLSHRSCGWDPGERIQNAHSGASDAEDASKTRVWARRAAKIASTRAFWRLGRAHSRVLARFGVQSTCFHMVLVVGNPENASKTYYLLLYLLLTACYLLRITSNF